MRGEIRMTGYEEFRKELLNDPEVAAEYEALVVHPSSF